MFAYPASDQFISIIEFEIRQKREEGCDVSQIEPRVETAGSDHAKLFEIWHALQDLPASWVSDEPNGLDEIRRQCPTHGPDVSPVQLSEAVLKDRIYGAWLGRCAGLVLGKPLEASPFVRDWRQVKAYLSAANAWPLDGYVPDSDAGCRVVGRSMLPAPESHRGKIQYVQADDDIRYTVMGLDVLERVGPTFTVADVAAWWCDHLSASDVFSAEAAAYRNLIWLGGQYEPQKLVPDQWDFVREWLNPYREWIGAQIRADGWAYACSGNPALAAEFAYRDARLSHVKNGVYGEMFVAGMIAAAASHDCPRDIISAGLTQIPQNCRLAKAIHETIAFCDSVNCAFDRLEEVIEWLYDHFGNYYWVHTINNAAVVVAALLLGDGDFGRTICSAVMAGWDTDCNGATVGSIAGMMLGASQLPDEWIAPLNDTLKSGVPGFDPIPISECAQRHVAIARKISEGS